MLTDTCAICQGTIYPEDERVSKGLDLYHFECAESQNIEENDE
jgi:hypothetical protein